MNILSAFLVAVGLSMDNFAVTIASGCCHRARVPVSYAFKVGVMFTLAHLVMFSAGWLFGAGTGRFINVVDHWIAFFILVFIGGRMIKESRSDKAEADVCVLHSLKTLFVLSVATSLDALLVGMGMAFTSASFGQLAWMLAACVMITSVTGFYVGAWLGRKFGKMMEAAGGAVLVLISVKLLLEGLGIW